ESTTGKDDPRDPNYNPDDPYNVYRFNSKRWDPHTGKVDMGFRDYDPGLNRFLTRDMYNGALEDMQLTLDPWNMNRYAFAGGNPISFVELDGHRIIVVDGVYVPNSGKLSKADQEILESRKIDSLLKKWKEGDNEAYWNATPEQQQEMRRRLFSDPNEGWKPEWAVDGFLFGIDAATLGQGTLFKQGLKGIWNRKGNFIREGEVTTYNDFLRR